jgi:hypothetical protein
MCYAHATAAVLHMALLRIYAREGGCPSITEIRSKILKYFPSKPDGESVLEVLKKAMDWYQPLCFRMVDEEGARQAVLHRRPVLATFWMEGSGWNTLSTHFEYMATSDSILTGAHMAPHHLSSNDDDGDGGHTVSSLDAIPAPSHSLTPRVVNGATMGASASRTLRY